MSLMRVMVPGLNGSICTVATTVVNIRFQTVGIRVLEPTKIVEKHLSLHSLNEPRTMTPICSAVVPDTVSRHSEEIHRWNSHLLRQLHRCPIQIIRQTKPCRIRILKRHLRNLVSRSRAPGHLHVFHCEERFKYF